MNGPGIFKVSVEVPDRKDAHCCDVPVHGAAYLRCGRCCGLAVGTITRIGAAPDPEGTAKIGNASDFNEESGVIVPLEKKLKNRFGMGNAGLQGPSRGLRASAYHVKVVVRDARAVWLSRGNWQSSKCTSLCGQRWQATRRFPKETQSQFITPSSSTIELPLACERRRGLLLKDRNAVACKATILLSSRRHENSARCLALPRWAPLGSCNRRGSR
jgi:hypothetical protein